MVSQHRVNVNPMGGCGRRPRDLRASLEGDTFPRYVGMAASPQSSPHVLKNTRTNSSFLSNLSKAVPRRGARP